MKLTFYFFYLLQSFRSSIKKSFHSLPICCCFVPLGPLINCEIFQASKEYFQCPSENENRNMPYCHYLMLLYNLLLKVKESNLGLDLNGTYQALAYADDVNVIYYACIIKYLNQAYTFEMRV